MSQTEGRAWLDTTIKEHSDVPDDFTGDAYTREYTGLLMDFMSTESIEEVFGQDPVDTSGSASGRYKGRPLGHGFITYGSLEPNG